MEIVVVFFLVWCGVKVCLKRGVFTKAKFLFSFYKQRLYVSFVDVLSENNNESENNLLSKALFNILFGAACVILVLFVLDIWLVNRDGSVAGIFGDFFGGVLNPILTFLTFLGLIVTIVVQRHDLRLSRVEYEKTAEALTTQSVENTFFNTLDLHNKIADNIKFDLSVLGGNAYLEKMSNIKKFLNYNFSEGTREDSKARRSPGVSFPKGDPAPVIGAVTIFEGRAAFDEILKYLSSGAASPNQVLERYTIIQNEYNHIVGHYFRNLYQVLKMIDRYDESVVSAVNKRKYASILRAQLSTKELALLFINCLDNVCDKGKFKNLLVKYKMFEHLPCKEIKENKGRFLIGGSTGVTVDRSMLLQYHREKEFPPLSLDKVYGGAFGENRSIPYNLARKDY